MHYPHPLEIAARRRKIALMIGSVVVVLAGMVYLVWPNGPFGPYYEGRPLTSWLEDYSNPLHNLRRVRSIEDLRSLDFSQKFKDAERAVKAIGTNALPTLLQLAQAKDSGFKKICLRMMGNQSALHDYLTGAREKRVMAFVGFTILQKDALPAVPTLMALAKDADAETRWRAFESLVAIESPNLKPVVPVLVQFSHDPDNEIREKATQQVRLFLVMLSPDEAKASGLYDAFPELVSSSANASHKP